MDTTPNQFKLLTSTCWNGKYQTLITNKTKEKYTGHYRLGLNSSFIRDTNPF